MKHILAETNKGFKHGFVLTEQEFRRINDIIKDQFFKLNTDSSPLFTYILRYKNGVIEESENLDHIFSEDNEGSKKIIFLRILCSDKRKNNLEIEFSNLYHRETFSEHPIQYTITSTDRDWVFVTGSLLDERLTKIKRNNFFASSKFSVSSISLIFMMIFFTTFMFSITKSISEEANYIREIESLYQQGAFENNIPKMILEIEKGKTKHLQSLEYSNVFFTPVLISGGILILSTIVYLYITNLYPFYNFNWGEYMESFNRKQAIRKTINIAIVLGLIVSILGGIITKGIGF